jgi:hypothetical protein
MDDARRPDQPGQMGGVHANMAANVEHDIACAHNRLHDGLLVLLERRLGPG